MPGERTRHRGELESDVMGVLWRSAGPLNASEILSRMPGRTPAHTTLLTALDRLVRKGRVTRVDDAARGGRFAATRTEAEHVSASMVEMLSEAEDHGAALLKFAGDLQPDDLDLLRKALSAKSGRGRPAR